MQLISSHSRGSILLIATPRDLNLDNLDNMNKLLSSLNFPAFPARLSIYTFGHFYFEFMANYFLVAVIGPHLTSYTQMVHVLVIYNCFDYGCQIFIGLCDDIVHRNHFFAAIGAFLFAIAYFFHASAFIAAAVIGLGAAFIHVLSRSGHLSNISSILRNILHNRQHIRKINKGANCCGSGANRLELRKLL